MRLKIKRNNGKIAEYQGRKRKYYSITEAGKTQMAYLQGEWKSYRDTIDNIIEWRKKE